MGCDLMEFVLILRKVTELNLRLLILNLGVTMS